MGNWELGWRLSTMAAEPALLQGFEEQILPPDDSDERLIARVVEGDEAAFQTLYDRYFPRVFAFVRKRLNNRADAEETVQEVFINVFSSLASFRGEASFAAWVLGVSRRTVANRFKKKRHPTVPLETDDESEPRSALVGAGGQRGPDPLEFYEYNERIRQLEDAALHKLSPEQRQLFELHHLRHQSIQEIALELNKSENSVKSNLYRARKALLS
jgi:RNA polymerase sigma-70 factor (ECF subfamily)